jgi:hypothetical protein
VIFNQKTPKAFALIATIVLVAFLVLLLLGLTVYTRVETSVAGNSQDLAKARQNALAGLNIALGQLQRFAGPDAAVTARSAIGGSPFPGASGNFTGVWSTTGAAGPLAAGSPSAWLVSGTETIATSTAGAQAAANDASVVNDAANWVYLVHRNSVGATATQQVRLVKQPLTATISGYSVTPKIGHFAYWVADEGTKVSLQLSGSPITGLSYVNTRIGGDDWTAADAPFKLNWLDQLSLTRTDLSPEFGLTYSTTTQTELARAVSLDQLRFVQGAAITQASLQSNFHDFTPLSRGVLAHSNINPGDSLTPRLRADLTQLVASGVNNALTDYARTRPFGTPTQPQIGAVYEMRPFSTTVAAGIFAAANGGSSVTPVLSEAGLFFRFNKTAGNLAELQATLYSELWNPYAARLTTGTNKRLRVRVVLTKPFNITVTDGVTTENFTVGAGASAATPITLISSIVPAGEFWGPGEVSSYSTLNAGALAKGGGGTFVLLTGTTPIAGGLTQRSSTQVDADTMQFLLDVENGTANDFSNVVQSTLVPTNKTAVALSGFSAAPLYALSYGYELSRNISVFAGRSVANAIDPRALLAPTYNSGAHIEPEASSTWVASPTAVTSLNAAETASAPFTNAAFVPLFDLPRQEITSTAALRHMIGTQPYANLGAIMDSIYVSTVPTRAAPGWDWRSQPRANQFLDVVTPVSAPAGEFDTAANESASLGGANSARYQLSRGAFNVNSTSPKAWRALLGHTLNGWVHASSPVPLPPTTTNIVGAIFRTPSNAHETDAMATGLPDNSGAITNAAARSAVGRRLTTLELDNLAAQIATQVTNSGPFPDLASFEASTVLSAAIAATTINSSLNANHTGVAGWLTPQDILAAIAPFASARSDTFKVRAYGDVFNPATQQVDGRVWCEAIVQRIPDLAEAPAAAAPIVAIADPATYPFGRKFVITSFRWLTPDDL